MRVILSSEIDLFLDHRNFKKAQTYFSQNRVYNIEKEEDNNYTARVFGNAPLPYEVSLECGDEELWWECTCGDKTPCPHVGALIIKLCMSNSFPWKNVVRAVDRKLNPQKAAAAAELDLFQDTESQLSLFDLFEEEKPAPEAKPVIKEKRERLIFTVSSEGMDNAYYVAPANQQFYNDDEDEKLLPFNQKSLTEPVEPTWEELIKLGKDRQDNKIPLRKAIPLVVSNNIPLKNSGGRRIKYLPFKKAVAAFSLKKGDKEKKLFTPEIKYFPGNSKDGPVYTGASGTTGTISYALDMKKNTLVYNMDMNVTTIFQTLTGKQTPYTTEDIEILQKRGESLNLSNIEILFDTREIITEKGIPKCVLKLHNYFDATEIYFFFLYKNRYFSREIPYLDDTEELKEEINEDLKVIITRDREGEHEKVRALTELVGPHMTFQRGLYSHKLTKAAEGDLRLEINIHDFLIEYGQNLIDMDIELQIENRKISTSGDLKFSVKSEIDWFGVKASMVDGPEEQPVPIELDEVFRKHKLVKAGNSYMVLKEKNLKQIEYLKRQGMTDTGELEASPVNISLIDTIYNDITNKDNEQVKKSLTISENLKNFTSIEHIPQPEGLQANLRNYQHYGYNWLVFLHNFGLNGCLADDMGLGKTMQTLSLLQHLKDNNTFSTSVLIAPVVTLANWEAEIRKFTPTISYIRHAGTDRLTKVEDLLQYDLVIVSYHTLRNDLEIFLEHEFDYIILDEAHYIKNATSQIFKAIRSLRSKHRLSLTGTPIENNTLELWAQMNFLNPGILGDLRYFQNTFAVPIERKGDKNAAEILRKTVNPFILRRKKEDVLDDLPPKEEIVSYGEMYGRQAEIYNQYKELFKQQLQGLLDTKGVKQSAMDIFKFLLKLRQLAIHPPMAGPEFADVPSCKMDSLQVLLDEILSENHKVLIFSQFIGSLESIADFCKTRKWDYSFLTGQTPDRENQINRFQQDENVKVFLLSLKAGGVGINLTAADYVILFDPWWNPAAEKQAVDRAHRMGQQRKVISYKMITRGTIEEKILELQDKKNALADEIISEERSIFKSLSRDDIMDLFN